MRRTARNSPVLVALVEKRSAVLRGQIPMESSMFTLTEALPTSARVQLTPLSLWCSSHSFDV